jgi:hypothetical protein
MKKKEKKNKMDSQNPKEITRQQLKDVKEFSKEEQKGLLTISLNELMRDRLTLEGHIRERERVRESLRLRTFKDKHDAQKALDDSNKLLGENYALRESLDSRIKITRQLIQEIEDGRLVI